MPLNAPGFNLGGILQSVQGQVDMFQRKKQEDAAAKQDQKLRVTADPVNGLVNLQGVREDQLSEIMKLAKVGQETLSNYERMSAQNQQQQDQIRNHPFANTLAQLAASFAKNDPNPYTRAIGDAAQRLNPTLPELQRQQMGIMEGQMGAAQMVQGELDRRERLGMERASFAARQREAVQTNWEQLKTRFENPAIQHGITGNKDEFYAEGLRLGKSLSEVDRAWNQIDSLAGKRASQKLEDDKRAVEKSVATEKAKAPIKISIEGQKIGMKEESAKRLIEARKNASFEVQDHRYKGINDRILLRLDANRLEKLAEVPAKDREHLIALSNMDSFVDRMKKFIGSKGELKGYTGRMEGLLTQKLPVWMSKEDRQVLQHLFMVEKKRVIDFGGAGVRGWSPGEDAIKKLGVIETLTPAAADRVMDEIKRQIDFERQNVARAFPYAPWDKTPELLGGAQSPTYQQAAARSQDYFAALGEAGDRSAERMGAAPSPKPQGGAPVSKYPWVK